MDTTTTLWLVLGILSLQAIVWVPILALIRAERNRIPEEVRRSGETLVLGPERADYQGWTHRFGIARTMGTLALTDRRLLFKRPFGRDISILLSETTGVSGAVAFAKYRHDFHRYLVLSLRDGTEVVFLVRDREKWLEALRGRLEPAGRTDG